MPARRSRPAAPLRRLILAGLVLLGASLALPAAAEPPHAGRAPGARAGKPPARPPAPRARPRADAARQAPRPASAQRDLARVQAEIRSAEQRIRLTREQREQKEAELRQAELEIGALKGNMGAVQKDVAAREQRLAALQAERVRREQDRDRLLRLIEADLRIAQRQGGQDHYKLLLNQQDPQTLARLMRYYGYLQQARAGRIRALDETLAQLDAIAREEADQVQRLRALRGELQHKQSRLSAAQAQRAQAIQLLSAQLESEDERLQRLRRDQQALQAVVERLAREAAAREQKAREQREAERRRRESAPPARTPEPASRPAPPPVPVEEPRDFAPAPYKGHCPLPVGGGVRARFGGPRAGGLRWNGIVIAAPAGAPVRAIRPGRVAFADYLRGYGFLIIVDHGRGLMSLYGQNQTLLKKAGDDVAGNEVIAQVGDSGGSESNGLYFEIRVRGRPSDPAEWCAYQ